MTTSLATALQPDFHGFAIRFITGIVVAVAVTTGLFWLMQHMIATVEMDLNHETHGPILEFVHLKREEEIIRERDLVKPPEPERQPDPPPVDRTAIDFGHNILTVPLPDAPVEPVLDTGNGRGFVGEGDYLPIVKVAPIYPQRALARGLEGYCVIQYTVTKNGTIRDPFVIEDQCTSSMFHRASLEATLKFKYKPRVIDGVAVEVPGVQNKFTYEITE